VSRASVIVRETECESDDYNNDSCNSSSKQVTTMPLFAGRMVVCIAEHMAVCMVGHMVGHTVHNHVVTV
jgi:hypothetical protein